MVSNWRRSGPANSSSLPGRNCPSRQALRNTAKHPAQRERGLSLHSENKRSKPLAARSRPSYSKKASRSRRLPQKNASPASTPKNRISEKLGEILVLKQPRTMAHKNVNVSGLDVFVSPNHRVVTHGDHGPGTVGRLVHTCQNMNVRAIGPAPRIPLFLVYNERGRQALECRMLGIIHFHSGCRKLCDVAGVPDIPGKVRPPVPHRVPVKVAQQHRVVKADPTAGSALDIPLEGFLCHRRPPIRRIVELNEQPILRQKRIVDRFGVRDVVDGKVILRCQLPQPHFGCCDKLIVRAVSLFSYRHNTELHRLGGSIEGVRGDTRCQQKNTNEPLLNHDHSLPTYHNRGLKPSLPAP